MREPDRLSEREVIIVRGWFEGLSTDEIARRAGVSHRAIIARDIRHMRDRGLALPERPNSWRDRGRAHG